MGIILIILLKKTPEEERLNVAKLGMTSPEPGILLMEVLLILFRFISRWREII